MLRVIFLFTIIQFSMMTSLNEFHRHPLNLEELIEAVHHPKKRLKNTTIPVFYNVFVYPDNVTLATDIVSEQMSLMRPEHKLFVRSIGFPVEIHNATHVRHDENGDEAETLGLLWDHCQDNLDDIVVYLHNKGSFHPSEKNDIMRRFLTRGALSEECSNMPTSCDTCSSRMSPLPHPHTSGNMWVARCKYVQKLINPIKFQNTMRMEVSPQEEGCLGTGRFAAEHWVHSHPSVRPCDLSTSNYTWNYDGVPEGDFEMRLEPAPRFELSRYEKDVCPKPRLFGILSEYKRLYNETPSPLWWGWKLHNVAHTTDYNALITDDYYLELESPF